MVIMQMDMEIIKGVEMGHSRNWKSWYFKIKEMRANLQIREMLKYNKRGKTKAKCIWSQVCPSKPVGEEKSEPRGGREGRRRKRSQKSGMPLS